MYKVEYPFAICDNCNTVWPWVYVYCSKCGNQKLRYEGPIPEKKYMCAKLDDASRQWKI